MPTAREIMTPGAQCVQASETILDAARRLAQLSVGALPICGEDDRLHGMLTDRDIVVKVLAAGKDPRAVHASELAQDETVTVRADDDADQVIRTMSERQVRRVPVIDQNKRLVGIVTQADVARSLPNRQVGELVEALSVDR